MTIFRIPKMFFNDHYERELPTPKVHKITAKHYWVSCSDPHLVELLNDAKYYVSVQSGIDDIYLGLCKSAKATCIAIENALQS